MAKVQAQMQADIIKHLYAHLPGDAYDPDEITIKASAVFAHIYSTGLDVGAPVYH